MSLKQIFISFVSPDPERPDASEAVVIDDELRSWLSPMGIADLEDYFSELMDEGEGQWPVLLSATEPGPNEDKS